MNKLSATLLATAAMATSAQAGDVRHLMGPIMANPTPGQIEAKCAFYIGEIDLRRDALLGDQAAPTIANTLERIDNMFGLSNAAGGEFTLYRQVLTTPEQRDAAADCEVRIDSLYNELGLSREVYDRLVTLDLTDADAVTQRYAETLRRDFEASGVALDDEQRTRINAIKDELGELSAAFARNIANDKSEITFTLDELTGVPEDFIASRELNADGSLTLTTSYTDYQPVMQYADNDEVRRRFAELYDLRAWPENDAVLAQMFTLRAELAQLLGRENYAQYALADKMLQEPARVRQLMAEVEQAARPIAQNDYARMLTVLQDLQPGAERIEPWQGNWLSPKTQQALFDYDPQDARQYFAYNNVRDGVFRLTERMFGIEIREWDIPLWHEDAEAFEVIENGEVIGHLLLDSHPRPGKYTHANNVHLYPGGPGQPPLTSVVQNLPKGDHATGLMEHSQVTTFLHEFGHALHGIFGSNGRWYGQYYLDVEWDFIEAPSQMLENWVYDYDTLATFAVNAQGETIPRDLVEKMNKARYFNRGLFEMAQLGLTNTSLRFHTEELPEDLGAATRGWRNEYTLIKVPETSQMQAAFGHLDGYSAYYYTYGWSRVIAEDLYARFVAEGINNPEVSMDYRRAVLEPGSSRAAGDLIADFLGREVTVDAFKASLNKGME